MAKATLAVVDISVEGSRSFEMNPLFNDPFFRRFFDIHPARRQQMSKGSGVAIDAKDGCALTNHHVVENGARIIVTLKDRL